MPQYIANCPRCGSQRMTFDVHAGHTVGQEHGWMNHYEICSRCRHCHRYTLFVVTDNHETDYRHFHEIGLMNYANALNDYVRHRGYISLKDEATVAPPEHVPEAIAAIFREGATCEAVQCFNAACGMYRLCVDLTTKSLLPPEDAEDGPNRAQREKLFDRLGWLFEKRRLPPTLEELSHCIRQDGNDAAHDGTVGEDEAADLQDFTLHLLENVYTAPEKLRLAKERRDARRE